MHKDINYCWMSSGLVTNRDSSHPDPPNVETVVHVHRDKLSVECCRSAGAWLGDVKQLFARMTRSATAWEGGSNMSELTGD